MTKKLEKWNEVPKKYYKQCYNCKGLTSPKKLVITTMDNQVICYKHFKTTMVINKHKSWRSPYKEKNEK